MANIKLKKILQDAFPMQHVRAINDYYTITAKKNSIKYFEKWDRLFESKWEIIKDLELDQRLSQRHRILDIGSGPYIFSWLAIKLGHYVASTELPLDNEYISSENIQWFRDIKTALELDKTIKTYDWVIDKTTSALPDPLRDRWDIITIQRSNFDIGWATNDYRRLIPELYRHSWCIYYEIAREQYYNLVEFCSNSNYKFVHSIGKNQGKVIIYNK